MPDRGPASRSGLRLIRGAELSNSTAQTAGMIRTAAISGDLVGAQTLWMGQTILPAGVSSGDHHHGDSETGIYVLTGHPVFVFRDPGSGDHLPLVDHPGYDVCLPAAVADNDE